MPIAAAAIIGGSTLVSGMMGSRAASKAADAQLKSARMAADAAKFRPYSITSGYGTSFFDEKNQTAGYELDPRLAAFRDQLYGQASNAFEQLGSTNPEAEAAKYVEQQMGLLQPTRAAEDLALRQRQLGSGRIGLGVSGGYVGGGEGLINPDSYQTQLAREIANANIAAQGTQYGQSVYDKLLSRGTGLFQTGAGIEQLGMSALTAGADIGKAGVAAGGNQAQALLAGGMGAANANLAGGLSTANLIGSAGTAAAGLFGKPKPPPAASPYYTDVYTANRAGALNAGYAGLDM